MSIRIASFFAASLSADTTLTTLTDGRIFPVARTMEDEDEDRIPYIIIKPAGLVSDGTKDDCEVEDSDTVQLLLCAGTYSQLVELAERVRSVIHTAYQEQESLSLSYTIQDYTFEMGETMYDMSKPCFYVLMTYVCSTSTQI